MLTCCTRALREPKLLLGRFLVRDNLLTAVKTRGRDVMTQVNFTGRCFNGNGRIRQGIVRTMVTATARGFFILLNSHFLHTPTRVNSHKVCHYIQNSPPRWRLCRRCPPNCVSLVVFRVFFRAFQRFLSFFAAFFNVVRMPPCVRCIGCVRLRKCL